MHTSSIIKRILKVKNIVIERAYFEEINDEEMFIIQARPFAKVLNRCPHCGRRSQIYDKHNRIRRWRSLDFGACRVYIDAITPRINCSEHGVVVARVPWARHDSEYTLDFETAVTWMSLHASIKDVSEFYRIKWDTVVSIIRRVQESLEQNKPSRFDGLEAIGIDETSYKKGHKYMTVVVNHETGHLIWAHKGHGKEVLNKFFDVMTEEQRASIKYVTADGASWIAECVKHHCPQAVRCIDPFHVVMWATTALDEVRKATVKEAIRQSDDPGKKNKTKNSQSIPSSKTLKI